MKQSMTYFSEFQSQVLQHGWGSGEIILELRDAEPMLDEFEAQWEVARTQWGLETTLFAFVEVDESEAFERVRFGLSTKPNYTLVHQPFSDDDSRVYMKTFCKFFDAPRFYSNSNTVNDRIWQDNLNQESFWESNGVVAFDGKRIGIFWINDIY